MKKAISYILKNKTLRFNSLANANAPMESAPDYWAFSNFDSNNNLKAIGDHLSDFFKNRTKVACFSRDDRGAWGSQEFSHLDYCARGHSKPRMWAIHDEETGFRLPLPSRVASMVISIERAPPEAVPDILNALNSENLSVWIAASSALGDPVEARAAMPKIGAVIDRYLEDLGRREVRV